MRVKHLFVSMFAAMAFVGCSNEDIVTPENNGDGEYGYMSVNIVQPKSVDTRANASTEFKDGSDAENLAKTGLFFIYDNTGMTQYGDPQTVDLTDGSTPGTGNPYVEKIYKAVLVVDGVSEKPSPSYQIVCILNAPSALVTSVSKTTTLAELRTKIENYGACAEGTFIMSNSVYTDGGNEVCGTIVDDSKLKKSAPAALADPVDIYVERVVAKIEANSATSFTNSGAKPAVDGTEKPLTINVTGIEVANIAEKSYLLKNITGISYTWNWNDPTNKRSYWETVPTSLTYGNKSYNNIATDPAFDITAVSDFQEYVQPNTSAQKTAILVTAQLMDGTNPADLAYIRGGYTTKNGAKNVIATYLDSKGYCKKSGTGYTSILPADIEWVNNIDIVAGGGTAISWLERYEVIARVTLTSDLYKETPGAGGTTYTEVTAAEINTDLQGTETAHPYVARVFTDGLCYYYVNIDQTPVATDNGHTGTEKFEGVIRNHIYDLTLTSIKGVGTPIFDPTDVIIPQTPEDEDLWFLGARINVLKWRLVKQTVNFEGK